MRTGTFSIVGRGSDGRRLGVALAAYLPAAGAFCSAARAGVGAVAVQGQAHPLLRDHALALLADGASAEEALARVRERDPGRDTRQIALIDRFGRTAAATGEGVAGFAGDRAAADCAVAASHLGTLEVLDAMAQAFADTPSQDLPERLVRALDAGRRAGGDARGVRSAAVLVVDRDGYPYVDLRVDDHASPVDELRRLVDLQGERFLPGYDAWVESLAREGR